MVVCVNRQHAIMALTLWSKILNYILHLFPCSYYSKLLFPMLTVIKQEARMYIDFYLIAVYLNVQNTLDATRITVIQAQWSQANK